MKFADIDNIWTANLKLLSNADRGKVYFERAKQVITEALADAAERERAIHGNRFRRDYLVNKIGSQPAVTTQNPKVKQLLGDTDRRIRREAKAAAANSRPLPGNQSAELSRLNATIVMLRRRVEVQHAEINELRRQLRRRG